MAVKGYPERLVGIGDHLRRRRLELNLEQAEVARALGVHPETVRNWELHRFEPLPPARQKIVAFLGYDPASPPRNRPRDPAASPPESRS